MREDNPHSVGYDSNWYSEDRCSVADFAAQIDAGSHAPRVEFACSVTHGIPVYDCGALHVVLDDAAGRARLLAEWASVMRDGAGRNRVATRV